MAGKNTIEETIYIVQYDRKQLRSKINAARKKKNTKEKFDSLIALTKQYVELTETLRSYGKSADIQVEWLSPEYWTFQKDMFKGRYEEPVKTKKKTINKTPTEKPVKLHWRIILSWSVPPENCGCSTPVENIKSYIDRMSKWIPIKMVDASDMVFSDRHELSHIYELECDKKQYIDILESAKYILEISSATERDMCNIGIYGKKFEK